MVVIGTISVCETLEVQGTCYESTHVTMMCSSGGPCDCCTCVPPLGKRITSLGGAADKRGRVFPPSNTAISDSVSSESPTVEIFAGVSEPYGIAAAD